MTDALDNTHAAKLDRYRFSIRGLMVLTFGIAVGLTAMGGSWGWWERGLQTAVVTWFALGLIHQARDMRTALRGQPDLASDERFGWQFAIAWRIGVVCMFAAHYFMTWLARGETFEKVFEFDSFYISGDVFREVLVTLALLIVLSSVARRTTAPRAVSRRGRWMNMLVWLAASLLIAILIRDQLFIHYLVYIATHGIELAAPAKLAREGFETNPAGQVGRFIWFSFVAAPFVPISLYAAYRLAKQSAAGLPRAIWVGLLAVGLTITAAYSIWLTTTGLYSVAPAFADVQYEGITIRLPIAATVILLVATVAAYRLVQTPRHETDSMQIDRRAHSNRYYHERRGLAALLIVPYLTMLYFLLVEYLPLGLGINWFEYLQYTFSGFEYPTFYLNTAVLVLAIRFVLTGWTKRSHAPPSGPTRLAPRHFFVIWAALILVIAFGAVTLAGFAFAIWLTPWYLL